MRILRAIRSVNPEHGGPIEGITQVSRILGKMGHEVELVSLDAPEEAWAQDCPIKVTRFFMSFVGALRICSGTGRVPSSAMKARTWL